MLRCIIHHTDIMSTTYDETTQKLKGDFPENAQVHTTQRLFLSESVLQQNYKT